ncbi:MAG: hypothetical protein V1778_01145 [bacterium]
MSNFSEGQTHQLMEALQASGYTAQHVTELGQDRGRLGEIRMVLDGRAEIVIKAEAPPDTIIRVDRSVPPTYPSWIEHVMHPELEGTGPAVYDLATTVSLWLRDDQKVGITTGKMIYDHLKWYGILASCLSLRDAEEIRKKGATVYQKLFGNNVIYFWKSIVRSRDDRRLRVPYLCASGDRVALYWSRIDGGWRGDLPAVRFAE